MNDLTILAGLSAGIALIGWGISPLLKTARDEIAFFGFKRRVRALWMQEVAAEDIIAQTGEDCWYAAFDAGQTPREAVLGVEF